MSTSRFIWAVFMALVVAPAFVLASSVEGINFNQSLDSVRSSLYGFWLPDFLGYILSFPITIIATIFPASSSSLPFAGNMIWSGVGIIATILVFINIAPPFNRDKDSRLRVTRFSRALSILVIYWVCAEILFGFFRDPIADTYTGNVYLVTNQNGHLVNTPLKAKLKLDVVDQGYVYDRRPGVYGDGVRIEFTGGDLDILQRYGVPAEMINGDNRQMTFAEAYCQVNRVGVEKLASFFGGYLTDYRGGQTSYAAAFHLDFGKPQPGVMNCGKVHLGVVDFGTMHFAMDDLNPSGYIFTNLNRDSHISPLQKMIMMFRFDRRTMSTDFGH